MTVVGYVVGVFDCFHSGHINIISKSALQCDTLIIGIHSDAFAMSYKRKPQNDETTRRQAVIDHFNHDPEHVIIIDDRHIDLVKRFNITLIFHGDDWELESYKKQIKYDQHGMKQLGVEIRLIPYTKGISTTAIIQQNLFDMSSYESIFFDLDNTLVLNNKPLMYAIDCIKECKRHHYNVSIITNNNRYSPPTLLAQLQLMGFDIQEHEIITSLHQVIQLCRIKYPQGRIGVWGTQDAIEYLVSQNINVVSSKPDVMVVLYRNDFTYIDLTELITTIRNGVPYVIGNTDKTYPDVAQSLPDTGSIANMIQFITDITPCSVLGKTTFTFHSPKTLYIGDSPYTDKVFAHNNNFDFIQIGSVGCDVSHLGVVIDYINHRANHQANHQPL